MYRSLALFVLALSLAACSSSAEGPVGSSRSSAERSPKEAVAAAALLLDVRSADEFASGHLDRAENIPVDEVESHLDAIAAKVSGDKTKPIAVYCAAGGRAARAKQMLEKAGYTNVTNAGGYSSLK